MSQLPGAARARRLAISVRPGRVMDGYGNLIATRLHRLATARSTGVLPFSGHTRGAIYFYDGKVIYAESARTPGAYSIRAAQAGGVSPPPSGELTAVLAITEATTDATLDLLSRESRYARFRSAAVPAAGRACSIPLESLLAEIARRQRLLKQLSPVVTPDTTVIPSPDMTAGSVKVSASQWALMIRVRDGVTPRELAQDVGRSVFGTTIEVYRLIFLGLLSSASHYTWTPVLAPGKLPGPGRVLMSFLQAASAEKG